MVAPVVARETPRHCRAAVPEFAVTMTANGKGMLELEVPLSSISPPLRREDLLGLAVRIAGPVGTGGAVVPLVVEERGGRLVLFVKGEVELQALTKAPVELVLGEEKFLEQRVLREGVAVYSGSILVQVSSPEVKFDMRIPALAEARAEEQALTQQLEARRGERQALLSGSSTWFGARQLEGEISRARALRDTLSANAAVQREQALARFRGGDLLLRVATSADIAPATTTRWKGMVVAADNARVELVAELANRKVALEAAVPELVASHDARISELEARVALRAQAETEVQETFGALDVAAQGRWLVEFAEATHAPGAAELRSAFSDLKSANVTVGLLEEDLARATLQQREAYPSQLAHLDAGLSSTAERLAALSVRVKQLEAGAPVLDTVKVKEE